jgi:hypothetical protein
MTSQTSRSAAAVNRSADLSTLPRLDRGEHRQTIKLGGIPGLETLDSSSRGMSSQTYQNGRGVILK